MSKSFPTFVGCTILGVNKTDEEISFDTTRSRLISFTEKRGRTPGSPMREKAPDCSGAFRPL